jgi:hypothetical protein
MATTTITGPVYQINNDPLANKWIKFRLTSIGTDSAATRAIAQSVDSVQTDANGDFSINIWDNGDSGTESLLGITVDNDPEVLVIIPAATANIELWDLIENYQAAAVSPQLPTIADSFLLKANNLSDIPTPATARQNLDLEVGVDVQAWNDNLDDLAALTPTDGNIIVGDGTDWVAESGATARTSLGLGAADTVALGSLTLTTDLAIAEGGTGASTAAAARTNLGIPSNIAGTTTSVIATTYTTLSTDSTILANNAAGVTITLLAAATAGDGFKLTIKNVGAAGSVTIDGNASETIDGSLTETLTSQYDALQLVSDGSNWNII